MTTSTQSTTQDPDITELHVGDTVAVMARQGRNGQLHELELTLLDVATVPGTAARALLGLGTAEPRLYVAGIDADCRTTEIVWCQNAREAVSLFTQLIQG